MALPMRKEESGPEQSAVPMMPTREECIARADALRKQLGRPLRMEIPDGLTDEEWEEAWRESIVATAEKCADEWIPASEIRAEMEAEGLSPPPEERERIRAELRAEGLLPPGR